MELVPSDGEGLRDRVLRAAALFGVAVWAVTEGLGAFAAIRRGPLLAAWGAVAAIFAVLVWTRRRAWRWTMPRIDWFVAACAAGCAVILALTALVAAFSPPNSADAMAYHM